MIKDAYCSYEIAKLLKEKGFAEPLVNYYYTTKGERVSYLIPEEQYLCPTHQMACAWLREEKRTSIIIEFDLTKRGYCPYVYQLDYDMDWVVKWRVNTPMKYEQAVEAALKYTLENLI